MKENQQACGERSRTISQIARIFYRIPLRSSLLTLGSSLFLLLFVVYQLPLQPVLAHGGGELQISNAPVGEYEVSVWNNPPTARAGQAIHITVGVAAASTGEPVLDAAVQVAIVGASSESLATAAATTEQSINRLFYEADFEGISSGAYEMQIEVTGAAGSGMLTFPLMVEPVAIWPWLAGAAGAGGVIFLMLRYWRQGTKVRGARRGTAVPRHRSVD